MTDFTHQFRSLISNTTKAPHLKNCQFTLFIKSPVHFVVPYTIGMLTLLTCLQIYFHKYPKKSNGYFSCFFPLKPNIYFYCLISINSNTFAATAELSIIAYNLVIYSNITYPSSYIIYNLSIIQLHPHSLRNTQAMCQPLCLSHSFLPFLFLLLLFLFPSFLLSIFPSFTFLPFPLSSFWVVGGREKWGC